MVIWDTVLVVLYFTTLVCTRVVDEKLLKGMYAISIALDIYIQLNNIPCDVI